MSDAQLATQSQALAISQGALSIEQLLSQRKLIENAMALAMKENQHFGKVAGCGDKPTLLQPGAQLLCHLFRLRPEYEIIETDLPGAHKRYRVTCRLFILGIDTIAVGEGVGEASSMESKHRFRNAAAVVMLTEDPVPGMYWDLKRKDPEEANRWLGQAYEGKRVGTKKNDAGQWVIAIFEGAGDEKVENPNPTDVHNTVLKMAKKRAFVDATITATASSDFFTQDLEDIRDNMAATQQAAQNAPKTTGGVKESGKVENEAGDGKTTQGDGVPGDWRTVRVHFGKKGGPILGKSLGELPAPRLEWLLGQMSDKPDGQRTKGDKMLLAALSIWDAERKTKSTEPKTWEAKQPEASGGAPAINVEVLAQNLDYANIDTEVFMRVARAKEWTKAETFDGITDAEARDMVDGIENVVEACREGSAE